MEELPISVTLERFKGDFGSNHFVTNSSAMAERPRELGDFKKARVNGGTDKK